MIEVVHVGAGWAWRLISATGRVLAYSAETFESNHEADRAAKAYRRAIWMAADQVDHRQARAI